MNTVESKVKVKHVQTWEQGPSSAPGEILKTFIELLYEEHKIFHDNLLINMLLVLCIFSPSVSMKCSL